ncbi:hypothetical protein PGTUg99_032817 [Puccinia graminis f. sp. tritici]|uniref:Uncharacterized protein n=1 Tax=Puccinia graminis f. sp. tritici TaxID=56615 RepID=A0A5B0RF49_PUCGR|nr:hypothetical protein PGTUg99_032817 [Puccinia graminis f. sp. tritici]
MEESHSTPFFLYGVLNLERVFSYVDRGSGRVFLIVVFQQKNGPNRVFGKRAEAAESLRDVALASFPQPSKTINKISAGAA